MSVIRAVGRIGLTRVHDDPESLTAVLPGRRGRMKVALFKVNSTVCAECSMALRRFIGGMDGVDGIDVESGMISVKYDESKIDEENLSKIARNSIERLGYRVEE